LKEKKVDLNLWQGPWELLGRILLAALLGGVLGVERDIHGRQAGLRTHLLVSVGAALFFILSTHISTYHVAVADGFSKVTDPARIAAQIVTGIGFLGAGVILKEGFTVIGLTTAACLWVSAAIGMASGAGQYVIAIVTTVISLFSLILLRWLERLYPKDIYRDLIVTLPNEIDVRRVIDSVKSDEIMVTSFGFERDYETQTTTARMSLRVFYAGNVDNLSHRVVEKLERSQIALKGIKWLRA
jgi:putative Mg2+ transporter-C (MgtC) family protein